MLNNVFHRGIFITLTSSLQNFFTTSDPWLSLSYYNLSCQSIFLVFHSANDGPFNGPMEFFHHLRPGWSRVMEKNLPNRNKQYLYDTKMRQIFIRLNFVKLKRCVISELYYNFQEKKQQQKKNRTSWIMFHSNTDIHERYSKEKCFCCLRCVDYICLILFALYLRIMFTL